MRKIAIVLALLLSSAAAAAPRVEIPIREVDISDGTRRYTIMLEIDGQPVEARLDTGSTGLRVLPRGMGSDARAANGTALTYDFGGGAQFSGPLISTQLSVGALKGKVGIMRIDKVGWRAGKPNCVAIRVDFAHYGIEGNGIAGQGFAAIIGTGLAADSRQSVPPTRREAVGGRIAAIAHRSWTTRAGPDGRGIETISASEGE